MSLMYSQMAPLGSPCPAFKLPGIDGNMHSLQSFEDKNILVVIVMCNHCPYVQAQWQRFVSLSEAFESRSVQFVGINANDADNFPEDSFEKMKSYAKKYYMHFPYLRDESQETVRALGAVCTPDIFVYDKNRVLVYRGRLDDSWEDGGKAQSHDLHDVLEALASGSRTPSAIQQPSQGCSIKWKR